MDYTDQVTIESPKVIGIKTEQTPQIVCENNIIVEDDNEDQKKIDSKTDREAFNEEAPLSIRHNNNVKTQPGSPCSNRLIEQTEDQDNKSLEDSPKQNLIRNLLNKNDSVDGTQRSLPENVYNNLQKSTSHELRPVQQNSDEERALTMNDALACQTTSNRYNDEETYNFLDKIQMAPSNGPSNGQSLRSSGKFMTMESNLNRDSTPRTPYDQLPFKNAVTFLDQKNGFTTSERAKEQFGSSNQVDRNNQFGSSQRQNQKENSSQRSSKQQISSQVEKTTENQSAMITNRQNYANPQPFDNSNIIDEYLQTQYNSQNPGIMLNHSSSRNDLDKHFIQGTSLIVSDDTITPNQEQDQAQNIDYKTKDKENDTTINQRLRYMMYRNPSFNPNQEEATQIMAVSTTMPSNRVENSSNEFTPSVIKFELPVSPPPEINISDMHAQPFSAEYIQTQTDIDDKRTQEMTMTQSYDMSELQMCGRGSIPSNIHNKTLDDHYLKTCNQDKQNANNLLEKYNCLQKEALIVNRYQSQIDELKDAMKEIKDKNEKLQSAVNTYQFSMANVHNTFSGLNHQSSDQNKQDLSSMFLLNQSSSHGQVSCGQFASHGASEMGRNNPSIHHSSMGNGIAAYQDQNQLIQVEDQRRSSSKQDISHNDTNHTFMPQTINQESVEIQCDSQDLMLYDHPVRANNNTINNCDQEFTQDDFIPELNQRQQILMEKEEELMEKEQLLMEKEQMLIEKEQMNMDKEQHLVENDHIIFELNQQIFLLKNEIENGRSNIQFLNDKIDKQNNELDRIHLKSQELRAENMKFRDDIYNKDIEIKRIMDKLKDIGLPVHPNMKDSQSLPEGPCVIEFPIINQAANINVDYSNKENYKPTQTLKMLEKDDYMVNFVKNYELDQIISKSNQIWSENNVVSEKNTTKQARRRQSVGGSSTNRSQSRGTTKRSLISNKASTLISSLNLNTLLQQQINQVQMTESILKANSSENQNKNVNVDQLLTDLVTVQDKFDDLVKEKAKIENELKVLTDESNIIKNRFTEVLSKFQGFVEDQEKQSILQQEKQINDQVEQESVIQELNIAIQEMEQLTINQKNEIEDKNQVINNIMNDKQDVIDEREFLKKKIEDIQNYLTDNKFDKVQVEALIQQIQYLKGFHIEEMEMYKKENKMLKHKMSTSSPRHPQFQTMHQTFENPKSRSQYTLSQMSQRSASTNLLGPKNNFVDEFPVKLGHTQNDYNNLSIDERGQNVRVRSQNNSSNLAQYPNDQTHDMTHDNNKIGIEIFENPRNSKRYSGRQRHPSNKLYKLEGILKNSASSNGSCSNKKIRQNSGFRFFDKSGCHQIEETVLSNQSREKYRQNDNMLIMDRQQADDYIQLRQSSPARKQQQNEQFNQNHLYSQTQDSINLQNFNAKTLNQNTLQTNSSGYVQTTLQQTVSNTCGNDTIKEAINDSKPNIISQARHLQQSRNSVRLLEEVQKNSHGKKSQSIVKEFIETYQIQFDQMEADLMHKDTIINGYKGETKNLRERVQEFQQSMDEFNYIKNENSALMMNNKSYAQQQASLEIENKDLEDKIIELDRRNNVLEHESKQMGTLSTSVEQFKAQMNSLQTQRQELLNQIDDHKKFQRQQQEQIEQNKITFDDMEVEKRQEQSNLLQKIVGIAEVFEKKQIDSHKYSIDILLDYVFEKSKKTMQKYRQLQQELKCLHTERSMINSTYSKQQQDENALLKEKINALKREIGDITDRNKKTNQSTSRSFQELKQLKQEKPQLINKIDNISKILSKFQQENNMLKSQIKQFITFPSQQSSSSQLPGSRQPLINTKQPNTNESSIEKGGSLSNGVSMMNMFPAGQVLNLEDYSRNHQVLTAEPTLNQQITSSQQDYQHVDKIHGQQRQEELTFSSRGIRHNSINRGGSCLQGLLGDSYDSRSHQTQVQDMSGIIGYGSSSFGMWKNVNRDDERY